MGLSEGTLRSLEWATGSLASDVLVRMEADLSWFSALTADQRSAIGLIAQSGVRGFVHWCREYASRETGDFPPLRPADLFGTAPRRLTRAISLQQTVALVRMAIETCEVRLEALMTADETREARELLLRYAREVAFAAADVYARAAESRGAWDARLETLVVDAIVRGDDPDDLASQASALSWDAGMVTTVIVADAARDDPSPGALRRVARQHDAEIIAARHGATLICVVGGPSDPLPLATGLLPLVGPGPVVVGPSGPGLPMAGRSVRAALSGMVAAIAWPHAPRPVLASWLLPERVLAGDDTARRALIDMVHEPLLDAGPDLAVTVSAYVANGGALEATARELFVHPNTVRYRLARVADLTGLHATDPRERWTLQVGLAVGRLTDQSNASGVARSSTGPTTRVVRSA